MSARPPEARRASASGWPIRLARLCVVAFALTAMLVAVPWLRVLVDDDQPSRSLGRLGGGRLEHGHVIPPWGAGYRTYSFIGATLGSQYAHGRVRDALVTTFAARAAAVPDVHWILGETAARKGGPFHGHRTHQNGLSADIFMPVRDELGQRATLPTWPWNLGGYGWDFDATGRSGHLRIDFEELAVFLRELERQARRHDLGIVRVIIAPEFVPLVLRTPAGAQLGSLGDKLTRRPVWVRHDEHVHVDFVPLSERRSADVPDDETGR